MKEPLFLVIDLFCGFGGTTTGFVKAQLEGSGIAKVIACINHDAKAIESHWQNHPEVKHFEEDIRTLDLTELILLLKYQRCKHPEAKVILWASLECTNFSKAKGGQPRNADSRTLADHLHRYVEAVDPDYIQIENVVEFMSWGPLDENGKPESRKNGQDWMRWCKSICNHGYINEWRELNSANFGAYTSRNRLFGVFAKPWLPVAWPSPTHAKNPSRLSMYGDFQKWMAVKEVLDFNDQGESIFTRKKPLSDKTLGRIYAGLIKYVAGGESAFIQQRHNGNPESKIVSVDGPARTLTSTGGNQDLVQAQFLLKYNSTNKNGKHIPPSIDEPCPVVSCQGRLGIVNTEFLSSYYGNGDNVSSIESPSPTLTTKDRVAVVQPQYFIDKQYGGGEHNHQSIEQPAGVIMTCPKLNLVGCTPFIMPTNFNNTPKSIDDPLTTITADRHHHYIVNPSHGGHSTSANVPCPVIIARQDKAPLYLVQCESGPVHVEVYACDSEVMIRIKRFMVIYNIVDIKMRMLRVKELLQIQGFPAEYKMVGNQADQKKFIGNSVVPHVVKAWAEAMGNRLLDLNKKVA